MKVDPDKLKKYAIPFDEFFAKKYNTPEKRRKFEEGYQKQLLEWQEEIQKEYADKIRDAREKAGFTQEELAMRLGISRTNVVSLESGKRNITIETFNKVARAMGKELKITIE